MAKVLNFYHIGKVIPPNAEYMGRAMPHLGLKQSKFANPFKLSKDEPRGATIEKYRVWLWEQIRAGKITVQVVLDQIDTYKYDCVKNGKQRMVNTVDGLMVEDQLTCKDGHAKWSRSYY